MGNNIAPVAIFTYNRPDHTKKALNALNDTELASQTDLYIFCDYWKKETSKLRVGEVRNCVDAFAINSNFRNVTINKANENRGLATSIIDGVTTIIGHYGKIIALEDDLIVSKHFLQYMNLALEYYQNKDNIWAISGYTFPMKALEIYRHDVYMSGRACSWGWATWKDRWTVVDWNVKGYHQFKHDWIQRYKFSKWGTDLPTMLDNQMYANINSWAIRWCYEAFKRNMLTVYPSISYITNAGNDGSGVHLSDTTKYDAIADEKQTFSCKMETLPVDSRIRKEFKKKYSTGLYRDFKQQLKWCLIRLGLYKIKE